MPRANRKNNNDGDQDMKKKLEKKMFYSNVITMESKSNNPDIITAEEDSRKWRSNFLDQHNSNPEMLARNLYPEPIKLQKVTKTQRWAADHIGHQSLESYSPPDDLDVKTVCRVLCNEFRSEMEQVGIMVDWIRTKKKMWDPSIHSEKNERLVRTPRFQPPSRVPFFCQMCVKNKQNLGLVANGILHFDGEKKLATEKDKLRETDVPLFSLHLEEIYYHSCECTKVITGAFGRYDKEKSVLLPAPIQWIFGSRYNDTIATLDAWGCGPPYATSLLGVQEQRRLADNSNVDSRKDHMQTRSAWTTLGFPINNGVDRYKFDDRGFLPLPGHPLHPFLSLEEHKTSMSRLFFLMICQLGIEADASPFLFDRDDFENKWDDACKGTGSAKRKEIYFTKCWKVNKHNILMKDVSLLFGGNEREVTGKGPVHQFCHTDCDTNFDHMEDPPNFLPCSFIVPLTPEGRDIYIGTPNQIKHIPMAKMFLLRNDVPHGGVTAVASTESNHCAAIHGYLDSLPLERKLTLVSHYRPPEHMVLLDHESQQIQIEEQFESLVYSLQVLSNIADFRKLDRPKFKKIIQDLSQTEPFLFLSCGEDREHADQPDESTLQETLETMLENANACVLNATNDGAKKKIQRQLQVLKIRLDMEQDQPNDKSKECNPTRVRHTRKRTHDTIEDEHSEDSDNQDPNSASNPQKDNVEVSNCAQTTRSTKKNHASNPATKRQVETDKLSTKHKGIWV